MNDLKEKVLPLISKIKKDKKAILILCIGIFGMLLILFSGSDESTAKNEVKETYNIDRELTEEKLENLLSKIEGAGKVKVMITYEASEENIYAVDTDEKSDSKERSLKSEHIIIEETNGETGMKVKTVYPKIKGVAVVCDGASNAVIKEQITSVISALFDISTNSISVVNMEN